MKPILFSTEMVRAILDGRKTQTRRVVDLDISNQFDIDVDGSVCAYIDQSTGDSYNPIDICRYKKGDILWVRETWCGCKSFGFVYRASHPLPPEERWKPSIHMPKEAARIFLKVTKVRVERLEDITEEDAEAEGVSGDDSFGAHFYFCMLWDSIYKDCGLGWDNNPWVWVIEFERCEGVANG